MGRCFVGNNCFVRRDNPSTHTRGLTTLHELSHAVRRAALAAVRRGRAGGRELAELLALVAVPDLNLGGKVSARDESEERGAEERREEFLRERGGVRGEAP